MPIPKDLRHLYGRRWRDEVRPRILARAGNRCEHCGALNGAPLWTYRDRLQPPVCWLGGSYDAPAFRLSVVQLGVAHLNHKAGHDDDNNLAALCRRCHLIYDAGFHKLSRSVRKDRRRPVLRVVAGLPALD